MNLLKIFILIIFIIPTVSGQSQSEKIQKMADLLVSAYNNKNYALLEQQFSELVKAKIAPGKLKEWFDNLQESSGKITLLGKPAFFDDVAIYPIDFERGKMELIIALDESGKIRGLEINVKKTTISRNKTNLILPFKGEWLIKWGGDTPEQNYHQSISLARFAFDFLMADENGKTHKSDGEKNEDYYAFGREIVAPADGVVTDVITGVRDNMPGQVNN